MKYLLNYEKGDKIKCVNITEYIDELTESKNNIDKYQKQWEKIKKYINDYEYIYTSPNKNMNISNIIPVSRSYFKMIEILKEFQLINDNTKYVFCMAEAPGGFIQCLNDNNLIINATTLLSNDRYVPKWNRLILNNKNIKIYNGINNNGDICDLENILSYVKKFKKQSQDIVTGDGGFDYSSDYNKQEINTISLIYCEILIALLLQKENGCFICKIFDIFQNQTIQLLYLLTLNYEEVFIYKPCISRLSNSEKYVICKNYKGYNKEYINNMIHNFKNKNLHLDVDLNFYEKIKEFNSIYTKQQINKINKGLNYISNENTYKKPTRNQIISALNWCHKYNVEINNDSYHLNTTGPY